MERRRYNRFGFTLLEVMIAAAVFAIIASIALSFSIAATTQVEFNTEMASALAGEVFLIEEMEQELAQSAVTYEGEDEAGAPVSDSIVVNPNSITFRKMVGYNPQTFNAVWSDTITYDLAPARGEIDGDGVDNNDNNLIDEFCLQRTDSEGQRFISTQVYFADATKLQFVLNNTLLTITLNYMSSKDTEVRRTINVALQDL